MEAFLFLTTPMSVYGEGRSAVQLVAFPPSAFDSVRLAFPESAKLLATERIISGAFAGMDKKIYGDRSRLFPRTSLIIRDGRVYALEKLVDLSIPEDWEDVPTETAPIPALAIMNMADIESLTAFPATNCIKDRTFRGITRAAVELARSGKKLHYSCGPATVLVLGAKSQMRVMYVPKSTWDVLRLDDLAVEQK